MTKKRVRVGAALGVVLLAGLLGRLAPLRRARLHRRRPDRRPPERGGGPRGRHRDGGAGRPTTSASRPARRSCAIDAARLRDRGGAGRGRPGRERGLGARGPHRRADDQHAVEPRQEAAAGERPRGRGGAARRRRARACARPRPGRPRRRRTSSASSRSWPRTRCRGRSTTRRCQTPTRPTPRASRPRPTCTRPRRESRRPRRASHRRRRARSRSRSRRRAPTPRAPGRHRASQPGTGPAQPRAHRDQGRGRRHRQPPHASRSGRWCRPGQPLLAVVPLEDVWVVANYKENQLNAHPARPAGAWSRSTPTAAASTGQGGQHRRGHRRALQHPAARERERQLREGGPARAGEDRARPRPGPRAPAAAGDVGGAHHPHPMTTAEPARRRGAAAARSTRGSWPSR